MQKKSFSSSCPICQFMLIASFLLYYTSFVISPVLYFLCDEYQWWELISLLCCQGYQESYSGFPCTWGNSCPFFCTKLWPWKCSLISEFLPSMSFFQASIDCEFCQKLICVLNDFMMFLFLLTYSCGRLHSYSFWDFNLARLRSQVIHPLHMAHGYLDFEWFGLWLCSSEFCLFIPGEWC